MFLICVLWNNPKTFCFPGLGWSLNIMGFNGWQHDGRMPGKSKSTFPVSIYGKTCKKYFVSQFFRFGSYAGTIGQWVGNGCDCEQSKTLFSFYLRQRKIFQEYSERDFFHELGYILHHIGNNCDWWKENRIDLF